MAGVDDQMNHLVVNAFADELQKVGGIRAGQALGALGLSLLAGAGVGKAQKDSIERAAEKAVGSGEFTPWSASSPAPFQMDKLTPREMRQWVSHRN